VPNLQKVAKILGLTEKQVKEQIAIAIAKTGNASKVASLLGISPADATDLVRLKAEGDEAGFKAKCSAMNLTASLAEAGLL